MSGPEFSLNPWAKKPTGYIISLETGELTGQSAGGEEEREFLSDGVAGTWNVPGGLQNPHDLAVSKDGSTVYVVELNPFKVWKLSTGGSWYRPSQATDSPANPLISLVNQFISLG